jgi:hypothetical protein
MRYKLCLPRLENDGNESEQLISTMDANRPRKARHCCVVVLDSANEEVHCVGYRGSRWTSLVELRERTEC